MKTPDRLARALLLTVFVAVSLGNLFAEDPRPVSFKTSDGGTIYGHLYGSGNNGVVLAHGSVFNKESWSPQAKLLAGEGFLVLAIDFRGYGKSTSGIDRRALDLDILGAIKYLKAKGADRVSVVGASMGANAAAAASIRGSRGAIDRLILLSPPGVPKVEELQAQFTVFIVSRHERFYRNVVAAHRGAPDPKRLEILDGDAHAQHVFMTDQGPLLLSLIVRYLR